MINRNYKVISLAIQGRNKIFRAGATVRDRDFYPGHAESLRRAGHLRSLPVETSIGVLIPTRDRGLFLEQAKKLLKAQTLQPEFIEIVDDPPTSEAVDITKRYRIGVERLKKKGAKVIIFWEDDDWYHSTYIETMVGEWENAGRPQIFGIAFSTYYNVMCNKHMTIFHPKRASMYSTLIDAAAPIEWGDDSYPYTDMVLWNQLSGKTFVARPPINLGIKHGIGMVGGGGHTSDFVHYKCTDKNKEFLKEITGKDFKFYDTIQLQQKGISG